MGHACMIFQTSNLLYQTNTNQIEVIDNATDEVVRECLYSIPSSKVLLIVHQLLLERLFIHGRRILKRKRQRNERRNGGRYKKQRKTKTWI